MKNSIFEAVRKELNENCEAVLLQKGQDYTIGNQEDNKLFNFEEVAKMVGLDPLKVAAIYWLKHVYSLLKYVKTGSLESEGLDGRFIDLRNYTDLMYAIYRKELQNEDSV